MGKKKLNVGLYVSTLNDESVGRFCRGAVAASSDVNANLIIFPGMHLNAYFNDILHTPYFFQYNTIYELGNNQNLDVLIVMTGNIGNTLNSDEINAFLKKYKNIPIITISTEHEDYSCIKFDNVTGLKKAINHLIHSHNCRKIGFVSGSQFNHDASERLETYCNTLLENNLPIDHNLIVYGNFSEFCEFEVNELIKNNPDIDAICFANDEMAKGGYNALVASNYKIGKDIAVIGFDNTLTAINLYPSLTTVDASSFELGYQAVETASQLMDSDKILKVTVPTRLVVRNSCGCKNTTFDKLSYLFSDTKMNKEQIASCTIDDYMTYLFGTQESPIYHNYFSASDYNKTKNAFVSFFETLLDYEVSQKSKQYRKSIQNAVSELMATKILAAMPYDKVYNIIDALYCKMSFENMCNDDLGLIFTQIYREISAYNKTVDQINLISTHEKDTIINSIINDVIITEESNNKAFYPVMKRLSQLGIKNTYMLRFEKTIKNTGDTPWTPPERLYLHFEQKNEDIKYYQYPPMIQLNELFNNKYISDAQSDCLVVVPLFSNEDLYGILICDTECDLYEYLSKAALQISTALKYNELLISWQNMLDFEKENNKNLEIMSKHDELTGVFNRRGYYVNAQNIISSPANTGKNAIVVFADMDNLKIVNDKFGHDDGDYAIRAIAGILQNSFRTTDIIGRIGGDEFAVFALLGNTDNINNIQTRIALTMEKFNKSCDKPYYVNMSVGIYPFICNPEIKLSDIMEHADELLYMQKKNKRKSVLKEEN
ncbi:MAG: GGDEF domain-containing protein [Oscillospiraceae bacterium]|nr:GGDEF domain-containing protein [Oscillospiraceae bacterium]